MGNLTPKVFDSAQEAISNSSDWRSLDYAEQYDDGWVAVYTGDKFMSLFSGKLMSRNKFRQSNRDRGLMTLRTVSMYKD